MWLAKVLGTLHLGCMRSSLPEAGLGARGETARGATELLRPHPPRGKAPLNYLFSGLAPGAPLGFAAPQDTPTGWAHCPAEVLEAQACPTFLGWEWATQAWADVWGKGCSIPPGPGGPPPGPPWEMRVDRLFGLLLTPTYSGIIFSESHSPPPAHTGPQPPAPLQREHRRPPECPPALPAGADWREGLSPSVYVLALHMARVTSVPRPEAEAGPQQ